MQRLLGTLEVTTFGITMLAFLNIASFTRLTKLPIGCCILHGLIAVLTYCWSTFIRTTRPLAISIFLQRATCLLLSEPSLHQLCNGGVAAVDGCDAGCGDDGVGI